MTRSDRPSKKRYSLAKSRQSPDDDDSENQELGESESQTDGESRKATTNPGLQMACEFLRKYGKDGNEEDSGFSSKVPLGLNTKNDDNKREGKQQESMALGISSGVCYKFQRSGKCTRRDCRYKHIYSEASYPDYSFKNSPDGVEGYQGRKNGVCNEFERTVSNCESWSNMTPEDYKVLQSTQLLYLWNVMEVSRATPAVALFLELGILPVSFEIEKDSYFSSSARLIMTK